MRAEHYVEEATEMQKRWRPQVDIEKNNGITKAEEDRSETSRSKKKHCRRSDTVERTRRGRTSPRRYNTPAVEGATRSQGRSQ